MFFRGYNRNFSERNFAHKSKHDKRFLQGNSRKHLEIYPTQSEEDHGSHP